MKRLMTANYAAACAVKACRVQVVAAYPITPQTTIVERLAELVASGDMPAKMFKVESEHSAMAACIGASITGARVFTATSSQGIAYMHELLPTAAGSRLPIVMVDANRSLAAPWNLGVDQIDTLSQRDTGWLQFYCQNNQEVLDTIIQAYRIAEQVNLPIMVTQDGFYLSHTTELVDVPDIELVDRYLPPRVPLYKLSPDNPASYNGTTNGFEYTNFRYHTCQAMSQASKVVNEALDEFAQVFGRRHGVIESDHLDDAEIALVAIGSVAGTIRQVVRDMRSNGQKVGLVRIRMFRPFPTAELGAALAHVGKIAVIDRDVSTSSGGIICQEVKAALYGQPGFGDKPVFGFIAGLGGADITTDDIVKMTKYVMERDIPEKEPVWVEVRL